MKERGIPQVPVLPSIFTPLLPRSPLPRSSSTRFLLLPTASAKCAMIHLRGVGPGLETEPKLKGNATTSYGRGPPRCAD